MQILIVDFEYSTIFAYFWDEAVHRTVNYDEKRIKPSNPKSNFQSVKCMSSKKYESELQRH